MQEKKSILKQLPFIILYSSLLLLLWSIPCMAYKNMPGEGITVKPARASWTSGFFLEALYSQAMEGLGYNVLNYKELSNPIFYQAVVYGDVDFWANGWFPIHNAQLPENFDERASKIGYVVKAGGVQGYLVSKKEVEKFNITNLNDFKREEVKKAFDSNDDGKADLVACPPGWGCEKVIAHHLKVYDLEKHVNPIKASYSASMADAVGRYSNDQPIFFYTWTPNWTVFKLKPGKDVMWIGVPEIIPAPAQKGLEDALTISGIKGAVNDPLKIGWVANDIRVVANNEFLQKNPAAKRLFEVMSVPLADIAEQNAKMYNGEDKQRDIKRHAREWIEAHQQEWNNWLEQARKAAY